MTPRRTVVDSSVIVKWLSQQNEKYVKEANKVLEDAKEGRIELYAPEQAKYEVTNALLSGKHLSPTNVKVSLTTLYLLPLQFVSETLELTETAYNFGYKFGITYYDATFVALTKFLNGALVTDNPKHQTKVEGVKVLPLKNYR